MIRPVLGNVWAWLCWGRNSSTKSLFTEPLCIIRCWACLDWINTTIMFLITPVLHNIKMSPGRKVSLLHKAVWVCTTIKMFNISMLHNVFPIEFLSVLTAVCHLFCRFWAKIKSNLFARPSSSQGNSMPGRRESLSPSCTRTMEQSTSVRTTSFVQRSVPLL